VGEIYKVWKNTKLVYKVVGELFLCFCQNNKNTKWIYKVVGDALYYVALAPWAYYIGYIGLTHHVGRQCGSIFIYSNNKVNLKLNA
jgi:hypothetical protein